MDAQEQNLCLLNMPLLPLEKILSNIHNPSNISRTCKYLYEIFCGMEKRRRVMCIGALDAKSPLNIDDDAVFDSIMNSHRTIREIKLRLETFDDTDFKVDPWRELNEQQLERMTAIVKQFGANVTSLKLRLFVVPISLIFELLQRATKLESLSFSGGKAVGSVTENTIMSLQLPSLKSLKILCFPGLLDIVNLIPDGSLNYCEINTSSSIESNDALSTILKKQNNIKSLHVISDSDLADLSVNHLQLDTLTFGCSHGFDKGSQFVEILKWQTNLKELKFSNFNGVSESVIQWICDNLKNLEVLELHRLEGISGNVFQMLKRLRILRISEGHELFYNAFQLKSDSIERLEIGCGPGRSCGEVLNSIAYNLPNLTHLKMRFANFSDLSFILRHCPKINHLRSFIDDPIPDQLSHQRFPNIQTLELYNQNFFRIDTDYEVLSQSMTSIVHAMPNLKSMSLSADDFFKFDVDTMREFIEGSKNLEYFYVDRFQLNRELSADDVIETVRSLTDQLKGYHINFIPCKSADDLNFHKIKEALSNEFYLRDYNETFYLYKGGVKKFHNSSFLLLD